VPVTSDPALWRRAVGLGECVVWLHTYGAAYPGPDRPAGDVRYPHGDERQPLCRKAVTTLPEALSYDAARQVVVLGDGEFGPVSQDVWDYAVGGRPILRSWFNYRKRSPGGRKGSPLDHIHVDVGDPDWTHEFIDLLTVLTRLVELEPAQDDLLTDILAAPSATLDRLAAAGTRWPRAQADRRPRHSLASTRPAADQARPTLDS
jgi:hypothetical protein